jgi:hypothetical protein
MAVGIQEEDALDDATRAFDEVSNEATIGAPAGSGLSQ